MLKNFETTLSIPSRAYKVFAYVPLDGKLSADSIVPPLAFLDAIFTYTSYDEKQIAKWSKYFKGLTNHFFHGVDTSCFKPLPNRKELMSSLFPQLDPDCLLVLNANRYNERKNISGTLQAFFYSIQKTQRPVCLILHQPRLHDHHLEKLSREIQDLSISDRVIINPLGDYISSDQLNELYQCCRLGINTSYGEGWGLVSFEHAAAGGAQLVPDHPNLREIWPEKNRYAIEEPISIPNNPLTLQRPSISVLAAQLSALYDDDTQLTQLQRLSHDHVTQLIFSWPRISEKWVMVMRELIGQ